MVFSWPLGALPSIGSPCPLSHWLPPCHPVRSWLSGTFPTQLPPRCSDPSGRSATLWLPYVLRITRRHSGDSASSWIFRCLPHCSSPTSFLGALLLKRRSLVHSAFFSSLRALQEAEQPRGRRMAWRFQIVRMTRHDVDDYHQLGWRRVAGSKEKPWCRTAKKDGAK